MSSKLLKLSFIIVVFVALSNSQQQEQRFQQQQQQQQQDKLSLEEFYKRINQSDVIYCEDRTKLLPECKQCIPGLEREVSSSSSYDDQSCSRFTKSSINIRNEIKKLTEERYGGKILENRPYGLYPYLERYDFLRRQIIFGKMLSSKPLKHIIDIGAYYNPIHLFLSIHSCPITIIIIEPILNPLSILIPCHEDARKNENVTINNPKFQTHVMFLPITFKHYLTIKTIIPNPETIVCIGCDSVYGPTRKMLETSFTRPYTLYLEFPSDYIHNAPYKKMNGENPGENVVFKYKFQPKTNETQYTKRVMKVIEYHSIDKIE